jgi:vanillate O-demethylase monooxygenase subunit
VTSEAVELRNELDVAGEERLYRAMRRFWHAVMYASELESGPRRAELLGEQLVVVRLAGEVRCFPDLCIHRGTALSLGWVKDDELQCAYHGWTYGPDGVCTSIPARFGMNIPRRARLHPYPVIERHGLIWVCLEADPGLPIPDFPEHGDPSFRVVPGPPYDWRTSAHRRLENFVDFAHFPWVHEGILGSRDRPEVPDHEVTRAGPTLRFGRRTREPTSRPAASGAADADDADLAALRFGTSERPSEIIDVSYDYVLSMPLTIHLERRFLEDRRYVLFMTATPVGPKLTRSFWFQARNYALDQDDRSYQDFEAVVLNQDQPVVESQRPEMLPVDLSAELHIRGADRVSVEYRKWLIELAAEQPAERAAARLGEFD